MINQHDDEDTIPPEVLARLAGYRAGVLAAAAELTAAAGYSPTSIIAAALDGVAKRLYTAEPSPAPGAILKACRSARQRIDRATRTAEDDPAMMERLDRARRLFDDLTDAANSSLQRQRDQSLAEQGVIVLAHERERRAKRAG